MSLILDDLTTNIKEVSLIAITNLITGYAFGRLFSIAPMKCAKVIVAVNAIAFAGMVSTFKICNINYDIRRYILAGGLVAIPNRYRSNVL